MNPSNDSNAHFGAVTGAYTPPTTIHNIAPLRIRVDRTFPLRNLRVARLLHPAVHEHLARSAVALAAACLCVCCVVSEVKYKKANYYIIVLDYRREETHMI